MQSFKRHLTCIQQRKGDQQTCCVNLRQWVNEHALYIPIGPQLTLPKNSSWPLGCLYLSTCTNPAAADGSRANSECWVSLSIFEYPWVSWAVGILGYPENAIHPATILQRHCEHCRYLLYWAWTLLSVKQCSENIQYVVGPWKFFDHSAGTMRTAALKGQYLLGSCMSSA